MNGFAPQGLTRTLAFVVTICFIAFAEPLDSVEDQCEQDGEAGCDRNVLLQLPGLLQGLNPIGKLYTDVYYSADPKSTLNATKPSPWHAAHSALFKDIKMKFNTKGDLQAFLTSIVSCSMALLIFCGFFCFVYRRYPLVYSNNVLNGRAPKPIPDAWNGWIGAAWNLTSEEIEKTAGLDAAMFMEFIRLSLRLCYSIGVPMVLILCPLHFFAGSDKSQAGLANDRLSKLGMGNIVEGEGARWIYWVHAGFVWFVVYVTQNAVCVAQEKFIHRRYDWILRMPKPRATTILVENIPDEFCTDESLRECFSTLFPDGQVASAYVVRKTAHLERLIGYYNSAEQSLEEAKFQWKSDGGTEETRPTCYSSVFGTTVDKINYYTERKAEAAAAVVAERSRLNDPANKSKVYSNNGFVEFETERATKIALSMKVRADELEFQMSRPPDPADVQYSDLYAHPLGLHAASLFGYGCIIALFFGFTPIVLATSSLINLDALRKTLPFVDNMVKAVPMTERLLEGVLASAALTLFMSFLPTFLNLIFSYFFQLKAGRWAQHRLQIWYYWFQVIFVLLVTAVGSSLWDTIVVLINHPTVIFGLLAERLPATTHFYLNFVVMQWVIHGLGLTRYVQLMKFKALCAILEEQRAKELAEPEDQDYYGMGARSARFTLILVMMLVYCSLCPLITVVTGINFLITKLIFGYLLVFAEGKKPDLGGVFWVTSLTQVMKGLFIYITLMIGVLLNRAASHGPAAVVAPALLYMARQYSRFHTQYEWEIMPFEEFVKLEARKEDWQLCRTKSMENLRVSSRGDYNQPEMTEPELSDEKLTS